MQKVIQIVEVVDEQVVEKNLHPCPFLMEICGDYDTLCDCSDEKEYECAMEV